MSIDEDNASLLDVRDDARLAATLGILANALSLVAPCICYLPCIPAIFIGIFAMTKARSAKLEYPQDDAVTGLADVATLLGLMSTIHAAIWLLILLTYVIFYIGIIALAIAAG